MGKKFFITGTDTDVGKTVMSAAMLNWAAQRGSQTLGLKPIAAGCENTPNGLRNSDALALMAESTALLQYEQVNPIALHEPIAPHIAAQIDGRRLSIERTVGFVRGSLMVKADFYIVEGAGGWRVPLNAVESLAGLPKALNIPVVLVVGLRLGCLNHAMLTAEAIKHDGLCLAGWIGNTLDSAMPALKENIDTLKRVIDAPCLGVVPYLNSPTPDMVAGHLDLSALVDANTIGQ